MKKEPLFSVIMPNYNNSKYLKRAIESILKQTYSNWELVIVDDSSTDDSVDIIKPYLKNKKIKLIQNKTNKGVGYSSHTAVENTSGEIIGTLDSDDVLHKNALKIMIKEHLDNPDHGLIYSNHYMCDEKLRVVHKCKSEDLPLDKSLQEYFRENDHRKTNKTVSMHFRTFKKFAFDKTEGYDVNQKAYVDRDLYYKLEKVTKIKGVDKYFYYYVHDEGLGAYRNNPKSIYYKFLCEYKEIKRRLHKRLPFIKTKRFLPFLMNIRYFYFKKYLKNIKEEFRNLFFNLGYNYRKTNKLKALYYYLNSMVYGSNGLQLKAIKKLFTLGYYKK